MDNKSILLDLIQQRLGVHQLRYSELKNTLSIMIAILWVLWINVFSWTFDVSRTWLCRNYSCIPNILKLVFIFWFILFIWIVFSEIIWINRQGINLKKVWEDDVHLSKDIFLWKIIAQEIEYLENYRENIASISKAYKQLLWLRSLLVYIFIWIILLDA